MSKCIHSLAPAMLLLCTWKSKGCAMTLARRCTIINAFSYIQHDSGALDAFRQHQALAMRHIRTRKYLAHIYKPFPRVDDVLNFAVALI